MVKEAGKIDLNRLLSCWTVRWLNHKSFDIIRHSTFNYEILALCCGLWAHEFFDGANHNWEERRDNANIGRCRQYNTLFILLKYIIRILWMKIFSVVQDYQGSLCLCILDDAHMTWAKKGRRESGRNDAEGKLHPSPASFDTDRYPLLTCPQPKEQVDNWQWSMDGRLVSWSVLLMGMYYHAYHASTPIHTIHKLSVHSIEISHFSDT